MNGLHQSDQSYVTPLDFAGLLDSYPLPVHETPIAQGKQTMHGMPQLSDIFKTRADFEIACKSAIPKNASWGLKVWTSMDDQAAKQRGKHGHVELRCNHRKNSKSSCSGQSFRIRCVGTEDGSWIVTKCLTSHDELGSSPIANPQKESIAKTLEAPILAVSASVAEAVTTPGTTVQGNLRAVEPQIKPSRKPQQPKRHAKSRSTQSTRADSFFLPKSVPKCAEPVYCYCYYPSYDEMIKCSGLFCEKQWFHMGCANLSQNPDHLWQCYDCQTSQKPSRRADQVIIKHSKAINLLAASTLPLQSSPHGPLVAFLNSLSPTLGDTAGQQLYQSGLTCPQRLQGMSVEQWDTFAKESLSQTNLSDFDFYTLHKTIRHWLATKGYSQVNKV